MKIVAVVDIEAAIKAADGLAQQGDWTRAVETLRSACAAAPGAYAAWRALGDALRETADLDGAAEAMDRAILLRPDDAELLADRAAVEAERGGRAAVEHYRRARAAAPADLDLLLGEASARREAGDGQAIVDLKRAVADNPAWLKGQSALASMLWQDGDKEGFTDGYEEALARTPADRTLWLAYLSTLMRSQAYERGLVVIGRARGALGDDVLLDQFEATAASEAGQAKRAEPLFAKVDWQGPGPRIPYLRHLLRTGRPDAAARVGQAMLSQPQPQNVWPYLATAWRLLGDPRWGWMEGDERLVAAVDLDVGDLLPDLAQTLRGVHRAKAAPFDQTLRGGTQTEGVLLSRSEPAIKRLRAALETAIGPYIASLPPPVRGHPFLGERRSNPYLAGSWSVLLKSQGFHINHVHPGGWISSAFYVDLPQIDAPGQGHAGWLTLGQPPLELELGLEPTRLIEPKPGRLALFPSLMWHGTAPFAEGERLTVAFDVLS